jgi:hypothetical protein
MTFLYSLPADPCTVGSVQMVGRIYQGLNVSQSSLVADMVDDAMRSSERTFRRNFAGHCLGRGGARRFLCNHIVKLYNPVVA